MNLIFVVVQLSMCSSLTLSEYVASKSDKNAVPVLKQEVPSIAYKRQKSLYSWVYDDTGTGCTHALTIHRPVNRQHGYYLLGDVAVGNYNIPVERTSVLVKDLEGGALAPPASFTWKWSDKGTRGKYAVTIYQMVPPEGFVCLGDAAVGNYDHEPDKTLYRCVKQEYVTKGCYEWVWTDTKSGGDYDCVIRNNRVSSSDTNGIDAGTFTTFSNYDSLTDTPYVLSGRHAKNVENLNIGDPDADITLFEMPDVEAVWDDSGTGASKAIGVWRGHGPSDSFSLGDFADGQYPKGHYPKPGALLVAKARSEHILAPPYEFTRVWKDTGSGGDKDVIFYKPVCPAGFRPLGHVAIASYSEQPTANQLRCVNETYTIPGKEYRFVWNDHGSKSDDAITVYEAIAGEDGQGLGAMTSVGNYDAYTETPFVLDPQFINYIIGKPASEYRLTNVEYKLDAYALGGTSIDNLKYITVENKGTTVQTTSSEESYEYSEETSWDNHMGGEFGAEMKITAGIPFIFKNEITVSGSVEYEHEWGGSTTTTKSSSVKIEMDVLPCSSKVATITGNRYSMDVPYTATVTTVYEDGTSGVRDEVEGIFYGVQVNEIHVVYEADIPLENCDLCSMTG